MKRRLNLRFALTLVALGVICAGVLHLAHGAQLRRSAGILREHADQSLAANQPRKAIGYLQRYLGLIPSDTEALARLGLAFADAGFESQAFMTLDQVLRREPQRAKERRRLVEVAMRMGRFQDAAAHLDPHLLKVNPADAGLHDLLGQCHAKLEDLATARKEFETAIELARDATDTYFRLATLLRDKLEEPALANQIIDSAVDNNKELPAAYAARARYRLNPPPGISTAAIAQLEGGAAKDLAEALKRAPDDLDVLLLAAQLARRQDRADDARRYLAHATKLAPERIHWYLELSQLELQQNDLSAAIAALDQGLKESPGGVDLLWNKADLLIQKGDQKAAAKIVSDLNNRKYPKAPVKYLTARIAIADEKWREASETLERGRANMAAWPDLSKQADFWLGHCYERLGNTDQQLDAFRRAASLDRGWVPARLGLAGALMSAGRIDEAIEEYRQTLVLPKAPADGLVLLARLMVLRQLSVAPASRNWRPTEEVLKLAESASADSPDVPILWAEWFVAQERFDEARQRLTAARDSKPAELRLWMALAALEQRLGEQEAAAGLLADAEKLLGDSVDLRLGKARFVVQDAAGTGAPKLAKLEDGLEKFSAADQTRLLAGLATGRLVLGDQAEATRLWNEVASRDASHLLARLYLFDLALLSGDTKRLAGLLNDIELIEGGRTGPMWRYGEAVRRVVTAQQGNIEGLDEAVTLLGDLRLQRPSWSRIPLLLAQIDRMRANMSAEADHLAEAMNLGDRNPTVVQRLVELLYRQRRFAEADQAVRKLEERQTPFSQDLSRLAAEVSVRIEDYDRALDIAERAAGNSQRTVEHIWHGQLLRARGRLPEAEAAFRKAIALDKTAPEPWVALVQHFSRMANAEDTSERQRGVEAIKTVLEEAQENIPDDERPLVLAQCFEAMAQLDKAQEQYEFAIEKRANDPFVQRSTADFFVRQTQFAKASKVLDNLLAPDSAAAEADKAWARRTMAIILASDRRLPSLQRSLELIQQNLNVLSPEPADRRARALILATWPDRRQRQ